MISTDGAGLIAQIYPVAILVLSLELRNIRDFQARSRFHHVLYWIVGVAYVITVLASIASVVVCVWAVNARSELLGGWATFVIVSGLLLAIATGTTLLLILAERFGVMAKIDALAGNPTTGP